MVGKAAIEGNNPLGHGGGKQILKTQKHPRRWCGARERRSDAGEEGGCPGGGGAGPAAAGPGGSGRAGTGGREPLRTPGTGPYPRGSSLGELKPGCDPGKEERMWRAAPALPRRRVGSGWG